MGKVSFTHDLWEIDAAVDAVGSLAQRFGISAIVPCTPEQYAAAETKSADTLYIVYSTNSFTLFYGLLPLSGGGDGNGISAGGAVLSAFGAGGGAGQAEIPEG